MEMYRQHLIVAGYYTYSFSADVIPIPSFSTLISAYYSATYQVLNICHAFSAPKLLNCSI